jgi:citrate synthase
MNKPMPKVQRRNEQFAEKVSTKIWKEVPNAKNHYIADRCLCQGYDLLQLMRKRGCVDVIYLLLKGELPTSAQKNLLEALMVGLSNPGPRHPATRAAMTAGVGKTDTAHILPIALSIMGGSHLGGSEVQAAMKFFRRNLRKDPKVLVHELIEKASPPSEGDYHLVPGFGTRFGSIDIMPKSIVGVLLELEGPGRVLKWGAALAEQLNKFGYGWLTPGVAAAAFVDLGFHPRVGAGLFQMLCAPGLLAYGLELTNKPVTAMPFIDEEHYFIDG